MPIKHEHVLTHLGKFIFSSDSIEILFKLSDDPTARSRSDPLREPNVIRDKTFYRQGMLLAVTVAPSNDCQFFCKKDRFKQFKDYYRDLLADCFPVKTFDHYFRIELSEPHGVVELGKGPRLHLHGFVRLNTKSSVFLWLCDVMPRLLQYARLEVTECNDYEAWRGYIHKQSEYMPVSSSLANSIDIELLNLDSPSKPRGLSA